MSELKSTLAKFRAYLTLGYVLFHQSFGQLSQDRQTPFAAIAVPASSTVTMATETVTIEKAYFEALLRR